MDTAQFGTLVKRFNPQTARQYEFLIKKGTTAGDVGDPAFTELMADLFKGRAALAASEQQGKIPKRAAVGMVQDFCDYRAGHFVHAAYESAERVKDFAGKMVAAAQSGLSEGAAKRSR